MYRLAHVSDLHYTTANRERVRSVLNAVRRSGADHLIVTGDLTEDARDVHMRGLWSLFESSGYSDTQSLSVIPGNHDLFGFIYQAFSHAGEVVGRIRGLKDVSDAAKRISQFRRKLLDFGQTHYETALSRFRFRFAPSFRNTITAQDQRCGFPFVKLLPHNVALIGIDSNFLLPRLFSLGNLARFGLHAWRNHDLSRLGENLSGSTGQIDISALESILARPELRSRRKIVLMHHYLYHLGEMAAATSPAYALEMRLINRDAVARILRRHQVEVVLHGHEHVIDDYSLDGETRVFNAGGADTPGMHCFDATPSTLRVVRPYASLTDGIITPTKGISLA